MNQLPLRALSPEEQKHRMGQLVGLMEHQVKGYHRAHHLGENTSVSLELAQELMASLEYTMEQAGGMFAQGELADILALGQQMLEEKQTKARQMLTLVTATAPAWQTECRWEAVKCLERYLKRYDCRYLAHRIPEDLFYPVLVAPPEGIRGMDYALFYLQILWIENQIMASFSEEALAQLWDRLPVDTLNQCEQVLMNALGKILSGLPTEPLVFTPEDYCRLLPALRRAGEEEIQQAWQVLCRWLDVKDGHMAAYAKAALAPLAHWTGDGKPVGIENVFL